MTERQIGPELSPLHGTPYCTRCVYCNQIERRTKRYRSRHPLVKKINNECTYFRKPRILGLAGLTPATCPVINQAALKAREVTHENRSIHYRTTDRINSTGA